MQHTYLRYECADAFSLCTSSSSSTAPSSNSILAFLPPSSSKTKKTQQASTTATPPILATAGSQCIGYDLRQNLPCMKLAHRERLSGGLGTGRALNSDEIVCIDVSSSGGEDDVGGALVATGWVDGSIRIFTLHSNEISKRGGSSSSHKNLGMVHSLLQENEEYDDDFVSRDPLVLDGHSGTAVRSIAFDKLGQSQNDNSSCGRLASGGVDGSVVVWDIIAETGLFRLLGHRGAITDVAFVKPGGTGLVLFDGLVTSSLDGMVKVWDLNAQCCTQTIASHRGEVLCAAATRLGMSFVAGGGGGGGEEGQKEEERWRLVTGSADGQVRVWNVAEPRRLAQDSESMELVTTGENPNSPNNDTNTPSSTADDDEVCHYMGSLIPPPNVSTSNDKVGSVHFHPNGRHVGVCRVNSKAIDLYYVRSTAESFKKRQRRLRRRREKEGKAAAAGGGKVVDDTTSKKSKKRGILDDASSDEDENEKGGDTTTPLDAVEKSILENASLSPDTIKAGDEFEYRGTIRATHKIRGFAFAPSTHKGVIQVVCALATNALEVHSLSKSKTDDDDDEDKKKNKEAIVSFQTEKQSTLDMYGHPTGIRSIALSSDDALACTVSKNMAKVWNVVNRSCIRSLTLTSSTSGSKKSAAVSYYGLCAAFLPGNTHFIVGTREGHILIIDIASGDIIYTEKDAHDGAVWALDLRRPTAEQETMALVTGSADKSVKFWDIERQDEDEGHPGHPMVVHARTLQMTDDVVAVRYSNASDPTKRLVFVSTLDSTVKVFFDDTLRFFLSLYGHKLPALAVDASDDDTILASGGADKTIKIWGLDFGDTHRTLHGHSDSITDIRFVRRTHNFFSSSKDGTVRYWDGDRFDQILLLNGHTAEVNCLGMSHTGGFVLSGGMDRQIRVWERTKDIVFLQEERERELEQIFDKVDGGKGGESTSALLRRRDDDGEEDNDGEEQPHSEAAVKRSLLSVSSGDRIMEAIETADQEIKDIATFNRSQEDKLEKDRKQRMPNPLLLGFEPPQYILWILRSVKSAELEQSLMVLPFGHMERLIHYLIILLRSGRGVEICSKVAVFLIKTHQSQVSFVWYFRPCCLS